MWHEFLQKEVFAITVFGLMSSDLMIGNPACGVRSILSGDQICRYLLIFLIYLII
jgi:hypothetical protein